MGKKRESIQVDEEKLKMMMAGEIPIKADPEKDVLVTKSADNKKTKNGPVHGIEDRSSVSASEDIAEGDSSSTAKMAKRKRNKPHYIDTFLSKPAATSRRQTTILMDEANYRNVSRILKTTNNLSIANFINNVLANHFEQYEGEIEEIQKNFFDNLYK